jgi:hypothetical protein
VCSEGVKKGISKLQFGNFKFQFSQSCFASFAGSDADYIIEGDSYSPKALLNPTDRARSVDASYPAYKEPLCESSRLRKIYEQQKIINYTNPLDRRRLLVSWSTAGISRTSWSLAGGFRERHMTSFSAHQVSCPLVASPRAGWDLSATSTPFIISLIVTKDTT